MTPKEREPKAEALEILPKPDHKHGYTVRMVRKICEDRNVHPDDFWEAFGVGNTCALDEKTGEHIYYQCDVERALYCLRMPGGKYHDYD